MPTLGKPTMPHLRLMGSFGIQWVTAGPRVASSAPVKPRAAVAGRNPGRDKGRSGQRPTISHALRPRKHQL
ncbi:hypothetical protein DM50_3801 [Burkholderia mallei]|nr:hypothetical protein DM50_3801 [Burkholderia mallei]